MTVTGIYATIRIETKRGEIMFNLEASEEARNEMAKEVMVAMQKLYNTLEEDYKVTISGIVIAPAFIHAMDEEKFLLDFQLRVLMQITKKDADGNTKEVTLDATTDDLFGEIDAFLNETN